MILTAPFQRLAAIALAAVCPAAFASEYALVSNVKAGVANVSAVELIQLFKAETPLWANGQKILVVMPREGSKEEGVLLEKIYKTDAEGLRRYWIAQIYQNHIAAIPKSASTYAALKLVEIKAEAMAVVNAADIPANDQLKVVTIDGKKPGDPGYLLSGN